MAGYNTRRKKTSFLIVSSSFASVTAPPLQDFDGQAKSIPRANFLFLVDTAAKALLESDVDLMVHAHLRQTPKWCGRYFEMAFLSRNFAAAE